MITSIDEGILPSNEQIYQGGQGQGQAKYLDEYISQTPTTLQNIICKTEDLQIFLPSSITLFGCVLICDVSGFTRLSTTLKLEDLRFHMNKLFSDLLGTIEKYGGDSIKLCGDAILSIWTTPADSEPSLKHAAVQKAMICGRDIVQNFGVYENNSKSVPVSLRLHGGLSAGVLHCMCLGTEHRMEWLISGPQLRDMGLAATDAKAGQLCISPEVLNYLNESPCKYEKTINGNYLITPSHHVVPQLRSTKDDITCHSPFSICSILFLRPTLSISEKSSRYEDEGVICRSSRRKNSVQHPSLPFYHNCVNFADPVVCEARNQLLMRFIHECARPHILMSDTNFLAEIRHVVTIFIELLNLQDDFDNGDIERPQLALTTVLEVLHKIGGVLRQYVVDDKGIVMICSFGLPNFNYSDNELKATIACLAILSTFEECDISCRIGISAGQAYCGYVGSTTRKEYCVMGPSVNLAARLMSKANSGQILVSGPIYDMVEDHFVFKTLDKILAKGYPDPIQVYTPIRKEGESYGCAVTNGYTKDYMIGRQSELSMLKGAVSPHYGGGKCSGSSAQNSALSPQLSLQTILTNEFIETNRVLILAPEGYGKSKLISTLCYEVKTLRSLTPVNCQSRMEPYQCMFLAICSLLNISNPFSSEQCHSKDEFNENVTSFTSFNLQTRDLCEAISAWVQQYNPPLYITSLQTDNQTGSCKDDSIEFIRAIEVLPIIQSLLTSTLISLEDWDVDRVNIFFLQVIRQMILNSTAKTLIIEDIQWCDLESYNILLKLLKSFDGGCFILTMSHTPPTQLSLSRSRSFSGKQVDLNDLKKLFRILELRKFTFNEIKIAIRRYFGPTLLASHPEILTDATTQLIFSQSDSGIPSLVISQLLKMVTSLKLKSGIGTPISKTAVWETNGLELDCRIVLKVASVCGSIFSLSLVAMTLNDLNYQDITSNLEKIFQFLQQKRLIRTTYSGLSYLNTERFSSENSITQGRGIPAYCFVENATLESIYGSLLDSQREAMHASIAKVIEMEYHLNPTQYSSNILLFLAHHWSKAGLNFIKQKVYYFQQAAEMTSDSKLYGETRSYYEQLISMSLNCLSLEDALKKYISFSSLAKKTIKIHAEENSQLKLRNSFAMNVLCLNRYMSREDFQGPVHSSCSFISLMQLSSYFYELSLIEFTRHAYLLSRNLFEFASFIGGKKLQFAIMFASSSTYFYIFSNSRMRRIMSQNFTNHALMSFLRGRILEAIQFNKFAMKLLDYTNVNQVAQTFFIHSLLFLSKGNHIKSQKLWRKGKTLISKQMMDSTTVTLLQLYAAVYHLSLGEFSLAERELSINRTIKSDTIELIPTCSKLLEAWLSFICGNCRRVENFTIPSCPTSDCSPEWVLHDTWTRQLRVILFGLKGNFLLAKRDLSLLDSLQSTQFSKLFQSCLLSFLEVCENQNGSSSQNQQLIRRLLSVTEKFDLSISFNLVSIILSFLTAFSCCLLLERISLNQMTIELVDSFLSFTQNIILHLHHLSSTYRFLILLEEVLQLKVYHLHLISQNSSSHPISSSTHTRKIIKSIPLSFFQIDPTSHSISLYPEFTFGTALWYSEMYKISKSLHLDEQLTEEYYQNAIRDLKLYNIPRDHPFSVR